MDQKINEYNCTNQCCHYKVTPYNKEIKVNNDSFKSPPGKIIKAGCFIVDPDTNKILLVQSRGQMWGPPKGTMLDNETCEECAVREVFEETGIIINPTQFLGQTLVKSKALYYTTEIQETNLDPQNHIIDNDANGIGWFNVNCLNYLIENNNISINQHCKILIKKFFRKNIL
jgi:ADP-ribose pyrophosphatase YjhB (NUDIX family)